MITKKLSAARHIIFIFLLYLLSFSPILINSGIFWDDLTIVDVNSATVIREFTNYGIPWMGYLHEFLLRMRNPYIYRFLTFFSYFFVSIVFYIILKEIKKIDQKSRVLLTIFFAIFPVNFARIALINLIYAICYLFFAIGFLLGISSNKKNNVFLRIGSIVFFCLSFFTNSFVVFFSIFVFYIFYIEKRQLSFSSIKDFILKNADYIFLPFAYWISKIYFFPLRGLHKDYNSVTLPSLISATAKIIRYFNYSFFDPLNYAYLATPIIAFAILIPVIYINLSKIHDRSRIHFSVWQKNFLAGVLLFIIAVFPYYAASRDPSLSDWFNRHQLLVSSGASLMLVYGLKMFFKKFDTGEQIEMLIFSFIISFCVYANFITYLKYKLDWYKQLSLISAFKNNSRIKNQHVFLFIDKTRNYNVLDRKYRFYEYPAMFKKAFGDEKRFGIDAEDFSTLDYYNNSFIDVYSLKDFKYKTEKEVYVYITENKKINLFITVFDEFFRQKIFSEKIDNLLKLRIE